MSEERQTLRQQLEFIGLSLAVWSMGLFPYKALRHLARPLGDLVCLLDSRGRRVARANLDAVFQDRISSSRKSQITRASYQVFARTILELFWSMNLTPENVKAMGTIEGLEAPFHRDNKQPVILSLIHI